MRLGSGCYRIEETIIKTKRKKKTIKIDSDEGISEGKAAGFVSSEFVARESSIDRSKQYSMNIPKLTKRSTKLFDLVNSIMHTKPILLEGIPNELIEPNVVSLSPSDWAKEYEEEDEEEMEESGRESTEYEHSGKLSVKDLSTVIQQGFGSDVMSHMQDRGIMPTGKKKYVISDFGNDTALEFLVRLGFSIEEAVTRVRNIKFEACLKAALTEASIWTHQLTKPQADLLILLSYKAERKMMRYFLHLAEAIANERIKDVIRLDGFIRILMLVEDGDIVASDIYGKEKADEIDSSKEKERMKREKVFDSMWKRVESESRKSGFAAVPRRAEKLLKYITSEFVYMPATEVHLKLLSHYIGHNLISSSSQIEAALVYLSEEEKGKVNLYEFEEFCGISREDSTVPQCWPWPPLELTSEELLTEMNETDEIFEYGDIVCSVN